MVKHNQNEFGIDLYPVRDMKKQNHEFSNSPIHEFKMLNKGQGAKVNHIDNF